MAKSTPQWFNVPGEGWFIVSGEGGSMLVAIDSFAKNKGLGYRSIDLSKGIRVIKGIYHIQNVNSYHSRLKGWLSRFKGVATKYLSNYLHWFEFIDCIAKDKTQIAAERALLLRACSVKAV